MAEPEEEREQPTEVNEEEAFKESPASEEVVDEKTESGAHGEDVEAEKADEPENTSVQESLEEALAETDKYRDLALRAEAEMQNMQRRTARDIENAHKFGLERFLNNLLPVVDSLEKAIESAGQTDSETNKAMTEGLSLCHKLLLDVLGKENVEIIDPFGAPFDPNEHQAMSMVENSEMEENSVCAVVQKGYKLNGRLIRAAMVMVTKPAPGQSDGVED